MFLKTVLDNRFESTVSQEKRGFDYELEGVRGIAALLVFISHVVNNSPDLMTGYHPNASLLNVGHSAVMFFFMMSGYVIGLTNKKPFSRDNCVNYLMRRAVRILPIYYGVLFFSVIALVCHGEVPSIKGVAGHFLFLQELFVPLMESNPPLWTLSYEIFCYLLYLLIWSLKPSIPITFILTLLPVLILQPLGGDAVTWLSLCIGSCFWLGGLVVAQKIEFEGKRNSPWVSLFLIFFLLHNLQPGVILLQALGLESLNQTKVSLADLIQFFPYCLLLISLLTGRGTKRFLHSLILGIYSFCLLMVALVFKLQGFNDALYPQYILLLLALITFPLQQSTIWIRKCAFFGKFSYAFYVIHWPVLYLLGRSLPIEGSFGFYLKAVIALLLSIGVSIILELNLQPLIKRKFTEKFLVQSAKPELS